MLSIIVCFLFIPGVVLWNEPKAGWLSANNLGWSDEALIAYLQIAYYGRKMPDLNLRYCILADSTLRRIQLSMRVEKLMGDGRLAHAVIPKETKYPVALPGSRYRVSGLTRPWTLCSFRTEYDLAERHKYWVMGASNLVWSIIARCVVCIKQNARPCTQREADLPEDRIRLEESIFTNVGVDFLGPINVWRRRSTGKRYGCLGTCLVTRAVHLEGGATLDTNTFLNAPDHGPPWSAADHPLRQRLKFCGSGERIENDMWRMEPGNYKWRAGLEGDQVVV